MVEKWRYKPPGKVSGKSPKATKHLARDRRIELYGRLAALAPGERQYVSQTNADQLKVWAELMRAKYPEVTGKDLGEIDDEYVWTEAVADLEITMDSGAELETTWRTSCCMLLILVITPLVFTYVLENPT